MFLLLVASITQPKQELHRNFQKLVALTQATNSGALIVRTPTNGTQFMKTATLQGPGRAGLYGNAVAIQLFNRELTFVVDATRQLGGYQGYPESRIVRTSGICRRLNHNEIPYIVEGIYSFTKEYTAFKNPNETTM